MLYAAPMRQCLLAFSFRHTLPLFCTMQAVPVFAPMPVLLNASLEEGFRVLHILQFVLQLPDRYSLCVIQETQQRLCHGPVCLLILVPVLLFQKQIYVNRGSISWRSY